MKKDLPLYITAPAIVGFSITWLFVLSFFFLLPPKEVKPPEEVPVTAEVVSRGPNWERRRNPDGTITQTIFAGLTNYQTASGGYEPIENDLSPTSEGGFDYQNTINSIQSFFKRQPLNNAVKLRINGGSVSSGFVDNELGSVNSNPEVEVKDNQITYKDVYPDVDVRYTILPGGVLEEYILGEAAARATTALTSLTQELTLSGGKLEKQEDGSLTILDEEGEAVGFAPPPLMYEENNPENFSAALSYELLQSNPEGSERPQYKLSKVLTEEGKKWLSDPRRVFPVVIDVTTYEGQLKDGYLARECSSGTYQQCRGSSISVITGGAAGRALYVGQEWDDSWGEWGLYRSYVSFDTSSIPDDATINSAALYMTLRHDGSDTDFDIKFYSGDWGTLSAGDWSTAGTTYEGVFRNTSGIWPDTTYSQSVSTSSIDKFGETQFRFTSNREEAAIQPSGFEDVSFHSANYWGASYRPQLDVDFAGPNSPPNTPSNPSPSSGATGRSVFSDLSWTGGDPDAGDTVTYDVYFEAGDSSPDVLVSNDQSGTSYDPGVLSYGTTYYWQIVAQDSFGETATGPVWSFSTIAAPSQTTVYGETSDGALEKRSSGGPFATCQDQMNSVTAATPTVGTISSDHEVGFYGGTCEAVGWMSRMYVSFDTSAIPDGDDVYAATLYLTLGNNSGIPASVGPVVDFGVYTGSACWGPSLDAGDPVDWASCANYQGNIIEDMAGTPGVTDTTYSMPINPATINKTGKTEFRIIRNYPAEDYINPASGDSFNSYVNFYSADMGTLAFRPRLVYDTSSGCTDTSPDSPTLSSPANGATGVSTDPTVSWNAISDWGINCAGNINTYEVFLDANPNPTTSRGTVAEGTTSMAISGLAEGTTYYWKVRASNGALSSDSMVWSFTTQAACDTSSFPLNSFHACAYQAGDPPDMTTWSYQGDFTEATINHYWGGGGPGFGLTNNFGVVWRGTFDFAGRFRFHTVSDDGVRVYLDLNQDNSFQAGERVIDNWTYHADTDDYSSWYDLSGSYRVMMEFFEGGGNATAVLDWEEAPYLNVSPTTLNFTATEGGSNPTNQGVTVWNTGGGTLSWTATDDQTWLSVSPTSYTGNSTTLWAIVDITGLSAGTYTGTITVTGAAGTLNSPQTVTVNLTIAAVCDTSFPDDYFHACVYEWAGASPPADPFQTYTGAFDEASFASPAPAPYTPINHSWGGGCPAGVGLADCDRFAIEWRGTVNFPTGTYRFHLRIDDGARLYVDINGDGDFNDAGEMVIESWTLQGDTDYYSSYIPLSGPTRIQMNWFDDAFNATAIMDWEEAPYLNVSPTTLNFTATEGGSNPTNQGVTVWNTGGGTLSWTATDDQTWLSVSPTSYTGNSTTLWAIVDITGLSAGTYTGTITVTGAAGTQNSPQTITVNLDVAAATGTISGYIWDDNGPGVLAGNGVKDTPQESNKAGVTVWWSGPESGSMTTDSSEPNNFTTPSLAAGVYTVGVTLDSGWSVTANSCGTTTLSCSNVNVPAGGSGTAWFGIWNNPSGWMQVKNGDVYAESITINVPDDTAEYERWFIADTSVADSGGGVAVSEGTIDCNGYTSERGWEVASYPGGIDWPALTASSSPTVNVINHSGDLTLDPAYISANGLDSGLNILILDGGDLTITGDVRGSTNPTDYQIYAVLIVKDGRIVIEDNDPTANDQLKIKGALYAEGGFDLAARSLNNNKKPAIVVEYDPAYLLQTVPGLTEAQVSWKEVK